VMSVKWGILGCGRIANDFVIALNHTPNALVVACAARDIKTAQVFSHRHGIPVAYGSYEELVKDKNVDIVYIATLHHKHYENTILALNHRKHVLVEKPAAINSNQLKTMYKLAAEKNLFIMEGLWTLFFPAFKKMQEIIQSGIIGEVSYVQSDFQCVFPLNVERAWNPELAGGGLLDIGVYSIGAAVMLINGGKEAPVEIKASGFLERGVDCLGAVIIKYPGKKLAVASWSAIGNGPGELLVVGSKGFMKAESPFHRPMDIVVQLTDGGIKETTTYHYPVPTEQKLLSPFKFKGTISFQYQASSVQNDILNKRISSQVYPPSASLQVMGIMDEVRRQIGLVYPFEKSKL